MKMKRTDRVIVGIYAVLGVIMLITAGCWTTGICSAAESGRRYVEVLERSLWLRLGLCVLLAGMLALGIYIIYAVLTNFRKDKKVNQTLTLAGSESGEVRVTVSVLESLVRQTIGDVEGVKSMAVTLGGDQNVLSATLDITVNMDAKLGDVTRVMQNTAREALERFTGLPVRDVTVMVSAIMVENQNKKTAQSALNDKA